MKKITIAAILIYAIFTLTTCATAKQETEQTQSRQDSSAPLWTGDGGKGISLAVLEPTGRGITQNEQWMLSLYTKFHNRRF